ncbi:NnrS family protein, partial [Ramlibacter sp.]|uniref:NnrS family protein n=1 Tax=Ramlibacter sp. TaxID=1917967 RepID=UPI00341D80C3
MRASPRPTASPRTRWSRWCTTWGGRAGCATCAARAAGWSWRCRLTAGHNWTGLPTPTGARLAALALLWLAARVLVLTPWGWASAIANAAFPLAAAVALGIPFARAGNRRNYFFIGLLAVLAAATFAVHMEQLGLLAVPRWAGVQLALDVVLFVLCVMGGRVIPMFTNSGVPGVRAARHSRLETAALGLVLALLAADLLRLPAELLGTVAAAAALAHLARWLLWRPWTTLRAPLVWVLHLAYAWIPVHLALRAAAAAGWIGSSPAAHALT